MKCDVCSEPAIYGDGVTWAKCAKHQYEAHKDEPEPVQPQPGGGKPHERIPGLTSIIIPVYMVNYALFHMTGNCIGAVREHTDKEKDPYEIIIIDNGSPVKPPNLQSYYADKVITNETNLGVSYAWNQGIRMSNGEYIVLLNNDTQVYDGWLSTLKKSLDQGGLDLVMAKPMYSLTEPFARAVEAYREQERWVGKPIQESLETFKDFSCVAFHLDLVNELGYPGVGLFDEQFKIYAQDSDLFKRMDQAGKRYATCKAVPIHHIIDATGNSIAETPNIMNEDKARFEEKWSKPQPQTLDANRAEAEVLKGGENMDLSQFTTEQLEAELENRKSQPQVDINLVRTPETGDKIFFVKDNTIHWVKNPETLKALGGDLGLEKAITKEEFSKFDYGEPVDLENVEKYK